MTIGIYCIQHIDSGKRYIGKSINIEKRFIGHKCYLRSKRNNKKIVNRYLYYAVQKHGWGAFETSIIEVFNMVDESLIAERELYWIDHFKTTESHHGYNLRRDSSTGMITHPETRKLKSELNRGENNPNFGNKWTDEMKSKMSNITKKRHADGEIYNEKWRKKQGETSSKFWKDNPDIKHQMAQKVSKSKQKYDFIQMNNQGDILEVWNSVEEILLKNPKWKWQNIYAVCNGYKKRIYGFKWRKVLKHED